MSSAPYIWILQTWHLTSSSTCAYTQHEPLSHLLSPRSRSWLYSLKFYICITFVPNYGLVSWESCLTSRSMWISVPIRSITLLELTLTLRHIRLKKLNPNLEVFSVVSLREILSLPGFKPFSHFFNLLLNGWLGQDLQWTHDTYLISYNWWHQTTLEGGDIDQSFVCSFWLLMCRWMSSLSGN